MAQPNPEAASLGVSDLAGLDDAAIDARLADVSAAEMGRLADELATRLGARLGDPGSHERFLIRLVFVEQRDVYERDVEYAGGAWRCGARGEGTPNVVVRWQGMAACIRSENGDLRPHTPFLVGLSEVEGRVEDQDAFARALAARSTEPLGRAYALRGLPDREVIARLERMDVMALLRALGATAAEAEVVSGRAAHTGRRTVTQFEVTVAGQTYRTQTVVDVDDWDVHEGIVTEPTYVLRMRNPADLGRLCTGESTLVELITSGGVELVGDAAVFARTQ